MAPYSLKALAALWPILIWLLLTSLSWAPSPLPLSLCYSHMGCSLTTPDLRTFAQCPSGSSRHLLPTGHGANLALSVRPPFTLLLSQPPPTLLLFLIPSYLALCFLFSVDLFPPNTLDAFIIVFIVCLFALLKHEFDNDKALSFVHRFIQSI